MAFTPDMDATEEISSGDWSQSVNTRRELFLQATYHGERGTNEDALRVVLGLNAVRNSPLLQT